MGFRFAEASRHVQHNPLPWMPDLLLRTAARVRLSLLIHESFLPLPWPGTVSMAFPAAMYTHRALFKTPYDREEEKRAGGIECVMVSGVRTAIVSVEHLPVLEVGYEPLDRCAKR